MGTINPKNNTFYKNFFKENYISYSQKKKITYLKARSMVENSENEFCDIWASRIIHMMRIAF